MAALFLLNETGSLLKMWAFLFLIRESFEIKGV
jgi:hypothetical protein